MRMIIQRVTAASVKVKDRIIGEIDHGLLLLVGYEKEDTLEDISWVVHKIINMRIFRKTIMVLLLSLGGLVNHHEMIQHQNFLATVR